jgi:aldose 1-epimerase
MTVTREPAGVIDGRPVERLLLDSGTGLRATILSYGATLQSLTVPGPAGPVELVLGFDRVEDYVSRPGYLGATVGRYGNRIAHGRFTLDGRSHELPLNQAGRHHLHGGPGGFAHRVWDVAAAGAAAVTLKLHSPDGDQGYPGAVDAACTYRLDGPATLVIEMTATTSAPTPLNMVHHSYWNLAGGGTIDGHLLELAADGYLEVDAETVPTGRILPLAGTALDFRTPRRLDHAGPPAIDHCFTIPGAGLRRIASLGDPGSGRRLELEADQPGVQVYSAFKLDLPGRAGAHYGPRAGLCLETEAYPDAPNRPHFPDAILRPERPYRHVMRCRLLTGP